VTGTVTVTVVVIVMVGVETTETVDGIQVGVVIDEGT
jgi:hypothetical protein